MKKILLALFASFILTGCTSAVDVVSDIQGSFQSAAANFQEDIKNIGNKSGTPSDSGTYTLQDEMAEIRAKKNAELEPVNKQISEREAKIVKILMDKKLTASQKKSKTTILQNEISTLKIQKEQIEEKYRKQVRDFRY